MMASGNFDTRARNALGLSDGTRAAQGPQDSKATKAPGVSFLEGVLHSMGHQHRRFP